jgi:S-adenosyl methyltransferase
MGDPEAPLGVDTSVAHSPRIWNYWLGGKDNYPIDREVGDQIAAMYPNIVYAARAHRAFLGRAVRYLAGQAGVRQFLDIGTGLPTVDNTHEVAQRVAPESRIVYVDNDPLILAYARALLNSTPEGVTAYIDADLHEPEKILQGAAATLDYSKPVGIMMFGILDHILDDEEAVAIVNTLLDAVPPGSHLTIAHGTNQVHGAATDEAVRHWNEFSEPKITLRTPEQLARFFDRLELLEPGIVSCTRWRPEFDMGDTPDTDAMCGMGRKN